MLAAGPDRRRRRALLALVAATLAAHLLLISGVGLRLPVPEMPRVAALQVRTLPAAAAPVAVAPPPPVAAPAPAPAPPTPRPPRAPTPAADAATASADVPAAAEGEAAIQHGRREPEPAPEPAASAPAEPASAVLPSPPEVRVAAAASAAPASSAASEADGAPPPLYATRLPSAGTLRYELRRGRLTGSGELLWRPEAGRYSLRLEGSVVGLNVLTQESTGTLDGHGLAPERFTDRRARRPMVAANFERETGRIRFSGTSTEVPWQPGVQDRLSWMMQLAAVAAAEPQRLGEGERIVLQVVGARGDASSWAFRSLGPEALTLFGERVDTVHLLREPRHPYDTRVEVWLDPAREHLPVRATMGTADEDLLELRLRERLP